MLNIKWIEGCHNYYSPKSHPHKILPYDFIIIHHTGSFSAGGTSSWFTTYTEKGVVYENRNKYASAHYLITEEGEIWQFVKLTHRAWHAGRSKYFVDGKWWKDFNRMSIGIELEGDGNVQGYTESQYNSLCKLCIWLMARYNIANSHILGHEQIAPKRKVNPGKYFDWEMLYSTIEEGTWAREDVIDGDLRLELVVKDGDEEKPQKRPPLVDGKHDTIFDFIIRIILLICSLFGRNR